MLNVGIKMVSENYASRVANIYVYAELTFLKPFIVCNSYYFFVMVYTSLAV